jgi:hypothetical protein
LFSALIGGIVGECVVFFMSGKTKFDSLEVGSLKITEQATLFNAKEEKDVVVIKDGSVIVTNAVVGTKFIGHQYQGNVFVGNRLFTSPDDLLNTSMEQWKFFTEIGSSDKAGGELIIRSPRGANIVGKKDLDSGTLFRIGFDEGYDAPRLFAKSNDNGGIAHIGFMPPSLPQQQPNANTSQGDGTTPPAAAVATPVPAADTSSTTTTTPPATAVAENPGNAPQ